MSRRVADMSVGEQQRVEILRTLVRGARVIILDEPTAALTPQETEGLFAVIRHLVGDGKSVIFISHKLAEVMSISSRITVLRRGKNMGTLSAKDADDLTLTRMMVGREVVNQTRNPRSAVSGEPIVVADKLVALDDDGSLSLRGASLVVKAGEIVGVAGVAGNGQRELSEALTGLRKVTSGHVTIGSVDLTNAGPRAFLRAGVGHVPEDRFSVGLAGSESIEVNAILKAFERPPIARGPFIVGRESRRVREPPPRACPGRRQIDLRPGAGSSLGGNAQRLLVGREVLSKPRLLVACHPTRGLDVAAVAEVHRHLLDARGDGLGVLLIAEDLDEIVALADRIVVMYEGRIIDEFPADDVDIDTLGLRMAGSLAEVGSTPLRPPAPEGHGSDSAGRTCQRCSAGQWRRPRHGLSDRRAGARPRDRNRDRASVRRGDERLRHDLQRNGRLGLRSNRRTGVCGASHSHCPSVRGHVQATAVEPWQRGAVLHGRVGRERNRVHVARVFPDRC